MYKWLTRYDDLRFVENVKHWIFWVYWNFFINVICSERIPNINTKRWLLITNLGMIVLFDCSKVLNIFEVKQKI